MSNYSEISKNPNVRQRPLPASAMVVLFLVAIFSVSELSAESTEVCSLSCPQDGDITDKNIDQINEVSFELGPDCLKADFSKIALGIFPIKNERESKYADADNPVAALLHIAFLDQQEPEDYARQKYSSSTDYAIKSARLYFRILDKQGFSRIRNFDEIFSQQIKPNSGSGGEPGDCKLVSSRTEAPLTTMMDMATATTQVLYPDDRFGRERDYLRTKTQTLRADYSSVNIAILDTGINAREHRSRLNMKGFVDVTAPPMLQLDDGKREEISCTADYQASDNNDASNAGHGTYMALTAAAKPMVSRRSGEYIPDSAGVAPGAGIYDVKVCSNCTDSGQSTPCPAVCTKGALLRGMCWVEKHNREHASSAEKKIDVVNISLGDYCHNPAGDSVLSKAVDRLADTGVVVVVAMGNANRPYASKYQQCLMSPASAEKALSVAGTTSSFTVDRNRVYNYTYAICGAGQKPDVSAPAYVRIGNNRTGGQADLSGTSISAAHASGVAALMRHKERAMQQADIRRILVSKADNSFTDWRRNSSCAFWGRGDWSPLYGNGVINALDSLRAVPDSAP